MVTSCKNRFSKKIFEPNLVNHSPEMLKVAKIQLFFCMYAIKNELVKLFRQYNFVQDMILNQHK